VHADGSLAALSKQVPAPADRRDDRSLSHLTQAILTDDETITRPLLDKVHIDHAAESASGLPRSPMPSASTPGSFAGTGTTASRRHSTGHALVTSDLGGDPGSPVFPR
jgi:hypothetical protein